MSCSNPLLALDQGYKLNKDGQRVRNIKFLSKTRYFDKSLDDMKRIFGDQLLMLPCGHCYMCSLDYSRMWASRIMLESKHHQHNCFITLTYGDWCVPERPSKRDFQLFMKRLRKEIGVPVRYFACGECGEGKGERGINPHYHAIIFGYDFPDKVELKRSGSGLMIYRSAQLEKIWSYKDKNGNLVPYGLCSIGTVSPESSQYVAKYSMKKKLSGEDSGEFVLMSRRPGIGVDSFDESDYLTDKLYINGKKFKMPRYFDKLAERVNSFPAALAKQNRIDRAKQFAPLKYRFNVKLEDLALIQKEEEKIRQDCFKRRLLV